MTHRLDTKGKNWVTHGLDTRGKNWVTHGLDIRDGSAGARNTNSAHCNAYIWTKTRPCAGVVKYEGRLASTLKLTGSSKVVVEYLLPLTLNCTFEASNSDGDEGHKPHFMYISQEEEGIIASISGTHPIANNTEHGSVRAVGKTGGRGNQRLISTGDVEKAFIPASRAVHLRGSLEELTGSRQRLQLKVQSESGQANIRGLGGLRQRAGGQRGRRPRKAERSYY
ncbi:hypothetical protein Btru_077365 [Bulinus truncatus]|nr:hypothetical protein Btru_077365 [Bulinus truncatus]